MTRRVVLALAVWLSCLLGITIASLIVAPQLIYPPLTDAQLQTIPTSQSRIQLQQAQSQLQNNVRSTLLQLIGGLVVVAGAAATWRQVHVNHEGQITERFTRAVEQIGSDNVDVRIGAVCALDRIARNSPADRNAVQFILCAFVRNHAPWHVGASDGPDHPTPTIENRPWLQILAPDTQAAIGVLSRRLQTPKAANSFKQEPRIYLSRVDLRGLQLTQGQLINAQLRYVLADAPMPSPLRCG